MQRRGFLSLVGSVGVCGCVGGRTTSPPPDPVAEFTATAPWPMAGFGPAGTGQNPASDPLQNQAEAWTRHLAPTTGGSVSPHVVTDTDTVYAAAYSRVTALSAPDGDQLWSHDFSHKTVSGLAVTEDGLLVTASGPSGPRLAKFEKETGDTRWTNFLDSAAHGPPVVTDDRIVVLTAAPNGGVSSFSHDGDRQWTTSIVARTDGPRAALHDESVFVADGGELVSLTAATGEVRWRRRLSAPLTRPPVVANGRVYATTASGLSVFETDSTRVWERALGEKIGLSCPCVTADAVTLADASGRVTGLDASTGDVQWRSFLNGGVASPLVAANQTVALATEHGLLTGLTAGSTRWTRELSLRERLDVPLRATLVPAHDRLYVALNDGWLYALG
ncbi:PQQ-binding-like beta-propeller repeat protein [Haladaptatus sp. CMSO5]|uniref:PQQ-binding-like beta-propeller repeat protein n=1 Tax=Haladaptatus sp. CMSO5 TaxID=3120514 RepID=UPI002FCE49EE